MKIYKVTPGTCKDCTLNFECSKNKKAIKHFLESKGLICGDGNIIEVVEVDN